MHVYGECCQQFSIHVLIHLAVFFRIGINQDDGYTSFNLKSDYQIFFLFTFEEITDVFFVFNSMYRSIDWLYTIVMFTRGSGLMFATCAQFLFKLFFFPEGQGV